MENIVSQNLTILHNTIRVVDGLFSLNDLHKASGGKAKHQPNRFLRNDQTKSLIEEIEKENARYPNLGIKEIVKVIKGKQKGSLPQGTFVCLELVYAYANWISASFYLKVIRFFHDGQQKSKINEILTPDQAGHIYHAVHAGCVGIREEDRRQYFADAWGDIKRKFGVSTYKEIKANDYPALCAFIGIAPKPELLEGELMPRTELPRKDQSNGLALMIHGTKVKNVQDEKISKAKELIGEAMHLIEQAEKCSGAIWDGLYESRMYMDFSKDERQEAHQKSDYIFECWQSRRKF